MNAFIADSLWLLEFNREHCGLAGTGGQGPPGVNLNKLRDPLKLTIELNAPQEEDFMFLWSDFLSKSTEALANAAEGIDGQQMPE